LSYLANTQTNKLWQKHNLLGGGKNKNGEGAENLFSYLVLMTI